MVAYTHKTYTRSRSIRISIDSAGKVIVTSPPRVSKKKIEEFVQAHEDWIQKHLEKIQVVKNALRASTDSVLLFGKSYKIVVQHDGREIGVKLKGDSILITPVSNKPSSVDLSLQRFFKKTASLYITKRVTQLSQSMQTSFNALSFKTQKTRWGSCSSQGNLNFNWRLIHAPKEVIDYVIVHELAHRTHMNHSENFWQLVEKYDPDYRQHRGWLKRNGMGLS